MGIWKLTFVHNWWLLEENIDNVTITQIFFLIIDIDNVINTQKIKNNLPNDYEKINNWSTLVTISTKMLPCVMVITTCTTLLPNFVYNVGCHLCQNVAQFCVAKVIIYHNTVLSVYGTGRGVQAFHMLTAVQLRHTIVTKYWVISLVYVKIL